MGSGKDIKLYRSHDQDESNKLDEQRHDKTCHQVYRPCPTRHGLYNYNIWLYA